MNIPGLLQWAIFQGRRPPWRSVKDPYLIGVAEVLLQKTKAEDVEPVWRGLVTKYTTAEALSEASSDDVKAVVAPLGLGNQRTARLLRMAKGLTSPRMVDRIPGLGSYGNGILSLSQGIDSGRPPIDGNLARVVSRWRGFRFERGELRKKAEVRDEVRELLAGQPDTDRKLQLLYALVDLGALVCKPRNPICTACPIRVGCFFAEASADESARKSRIASAKALARGGGTASDMRRI